MNFVFSPQADSSIQEPQPWGLDSLDMMDKPLTWEVRDMSPIKAIPYHPVATPRHPYTITFLEHGRVHTAIVDPNHLPYGNTGLPGSILDSALNMGIDLPHLCGGVAGCSTCHVTISQGIESCNEAQEAEVDQLEDAAGRSLQSRLACQCVPNGASAIVVTVPTPSGS